MNNNPLTTSHFSRLTTTGPAPMFSELQWFLQHDVAMGDFSGPLDAPAFFPSGHHWAYTGDDNQKHKAIPGLGLFDGRLA